MTARNAARKNVVKTLKPGAVTGVKPTTKGKFDGELHHHGCALCGHYYVDHCHDSGEDGICKDCQVSHFGRPSWEKDNDPQRCCRTDSRPALAREVLSYRLGGRSDWWICRTCCRTHPYNPTTTRSAR